MQADFRVIEQIDQLDDHDCRQTPDLEFAVAVTRYVPTVALVVDAMGVLARVLAEELKGHTEHGGDLGIVRAVLDEIRNHPDIRCDLDAVQGDQRAQRADHFDQSRWQADLFLGFAQGGKNKVGVFGVASTTGESDFATMGRQPAGAQGQYQFRLVTASNRHQDGGLGETSVSLQRARCVVTYPMQ
ncbi:hypothetical protein D3C76_1070570 [compost metagenome]